MLRRAACLASLGAALLAVAATYCAADDQKIANRWALLIGVDDYAIAPDLKYCGNDQRDLRDKLLTCGFDDDHLFLLHDKAADAKYHPSRGNIERELSLILSLVEEDDLLLVAFSGHGTAIDGKNYLCPTDATFDDPGSLVALDAVYDKLSRCPARFKLMLVDACRDELRPGNTRSFAPPDPTRSLAHGLHGVELPQGVVLLNSCGPGEQSWEEEQFGHGVYMYHVLEGLSGAADKNGDGALSLYELQSYAGDKTKTYVAHRFSTAQRPFFKGDLSTEALEFALLPISRARSAGGEPSPADSQTLPKARSPQNPLESGDDLLKDLGGGSPSSAAPLARPSLSTPPPPSVAPPAAGPPSFVPAPPKLPSDEVVPPAPASAYPSGVPSANAPAAPAAASAKIDLSKLHLPPKFEVRANEPWIGAAAIGAFGTSVEIRGILPNGPAAKAGLQPLDRLLVIGGEKASLSSPNTPPELLSKHDPGETIHIEVDRGGRNVSLSLTLEAMPDDQGVSQLLREAEAGQTWAMVDLGRRFGAVDAVGLEGARNQKRAAEWYKAALEAGSTAGLLMLAKCYRDGEGIEKDEFLARRLFELVLDSTTVEASPSIKAEAAMLLGDLYEAGRGVERDAAKAGEYRRRAAELGYDAGSQSLRDLLGDDVPPPPR